MTAFFDAMTIPLKMAELSALSEAVLLGLTSLTPSPIRAFLSMTLSGELLVETPIPDLLTAGIYAATELFLGGVPTALHTGTLAARLILEG
jgi:hypothetical protein